jgi:hypothetical protein
LFGEVVEEVLGEFPVFVANEELGGELEAVTPARDITDRVEPFDTLAASIYGNGRRLLVPDFGRALGLHSSAGGGPVQ